MLASGREFLAIPGPTVIPDQVLAAMQRPAVDIYSGPLIALTDSLLADLRNMFGTEGRSYIYVANGHGAWEAALTNVLSRGDKVLVLESGRFALGWGEYAKMLGAEVEILPGDPRRAVRPEAVEARLKADRAGAIKAILVVQVDTASGVVNDIPAIAEAVRAAGHDALLMVDTIASLACMPFRDGRLGRGRRDGGLAEGADDAARPRLRRSGPARPRRAPARRHAHALLGLDRARGRAALPQIRRHTARAPVVRAARRARHDLRRRARQRVSPPPPARRGDAPRGRASGPRDRRSRSTSPSRRSAPTRSRPSSPATASPQPLIDYCRETCGVVLGIGLGPLSGKAFRIAHMGHVNAPMILGTLGVVEMALAALGHSARPGGAQAAVEFLAQAAAG